MEDRRDDAVNDFIDALLAHGDNHPSVRIHEYRSVVESFRKKWNELKPVTVSLGFIIQVTTHEDVTGYVTRDDDYRDDDGPACPAGQTRNIVDARVFTSKTANGWLTENVEGRQLKAELLPVFAGEPEPDSAVQKRIAKTYLDALPTDLREAIEDYCTGMSKAVADVNETRRLSGLLPVESAPVKAQVKLPDHRKPKS